jgi:hypothetical protein
MSIMRKQHELNSAVREVILSGRPVSYLPKARSNERFVLVGTAEFERLCKAEKEFDSIDMKFTSVL